MIRAITTLAGIGHLRPAPGTWASTAAIALGVVILRYAGFPTLLALTVAAIAAGFWAVNRDLADRPSEDPAEIVIDELAGQWLALLFPAAAFWWRAQTTGLPGPDWMPYPGWLAAFLFFRLFDIWKPSIIGKADRRHDPAGVMLDDLWAGLFAGIATIIAAGVAHGIMFAMRG